MVVANSRGPQSLTGLVAELGPRAAAGTVEQAATAGAATLLSIPIGVYSALPAGLLDGRIVLDTGNYYPSRDGRISELDSCPSGSTSPPVLSDAVTSDRTAACSAR